MQDNVIKGAEEFSAAGVKVGIVVARFNKDITEALLEDARQEADRRGISPEDITVKSVAGSVEIPVVLQAMAKSNKFDCLVALGAVIRGETVHFEYVSKLAAEGISRVSLDNNIPIGFGVLMCETKDQALKRIHSGGEALSAALSAYRACKEL